MKIQAACDSIMMHMSAIHELFLKFCSKEFRKMNLQLFSPETLLRHPHKILIFLTFSIYIQLLVSKPAFMTVGFEASDSGR
jgi:hypothetical protein